MRRQAAAALAVLTTLVATSCVTPPPPAATPPPPASTSAVPSLTPSAPETPRATPDPVVPIGLTVMTYNTLTGRNDCAGCKALKRAGLGDELRLSRRMPVVAEKVRLADPDLIGFQENEGPDPRPQIHLAKLLPDYTWVNPDATIPIAVRSSRFTVAESGVDVLEPEPLACIARDKTDGRYVSWARLYDADTGRDFWLFNTHLHPFDTAACAKLRDENVRLLAELVAAKNPDGELPQLVIGDFNAFGDEDRAGFTGHLTTLASLGMADAATVAERDSSDVPGADSAGWMRATVKGRSEVKVVRTDGRYVDFIWVPKGTAVEEWGIWSGPGIEYRTIRGVEVPVWSGVMGSDHSPVVARLRLA